MPTTENQTILVTGASGFLATHVVDAFLRAGYSVRGTVRSSSTAEKVRQTFPQYAGKLNLVVVKDMCKLDAFDMAVQGVQGVIHTATPFKVLVDDNEADLLRPAIDGTRNILSSARKYGVDVKRIIITSSFAAMFDFSKGNRPGHVYSEADWNLQTYDIAAAKNTPTAMAYTAAKALAERAAWDFTQTTKPHFDIATILPPFIYGPNMNATANLTDLNASSADIYRLISPKSRFSDNVPDNVYWSCVDVRDAAEAHLRAYEIPEAGGERFLVCNKDNYVYQQICDALRAGIPEIQHRVPIGKPGTEEFPDLYTCDVSKSQRVLGLTYRPLSETVVDAARSLLALEAKSS